MAWEYSLHFKCNLPISRSIVGISRLLLELEDEDQIDCVLAQVGGASDDEVGNDGGEDKKPEGGGGNEPITIRVSE